MEITSKERSLTAAEQTNNSNSSEELIIRRPIEGTPFLLVSIHQDAETDLRGKNFISLGQSIITEPTDDIKTIITDHWKKPSNLTWEELFTIIVTIINNLNAQKV